MKRKKEGIWRQDNGWNIAPGQQLSLDLREVVIGTFVDPIGTFAGRQRAAELLRQLARVLGEQRAAIDLEHLRKSLVLD